MRLVDWQGFAPKFRYVFSISLTLGKPYWLKPTTMGATRAAVYAVDGTIEGPDIRGRVIPMSGGDWPLLRPDGVIDFDARYMLELDDGTVIYMQNRGYRWAYTPEVAERMARGEHAEPHEYYMRVTPKFDVPEGPHDWLSRHIFVGVAEKIPGANRIHYFVIE